MDALRKQKLAPIAMEDDLAGPDEDVIGSSLRMVQESRAYIGLIGHRCGDCPTCKDRNPQEYSVTRLEYEQAKALGHPQYIFVMHDEHPTTKLAIDQDPIKIKKLDDFKTAAKRDRIYIEFKNLDDFKDKAAHYASELRRYIEQRNEVPASQDGRPRDANPEPALPPPGPPAFHAVPSYLGSHQFVGRASELESIDDWADAHDPHPVLLFEAMGGQGKSMLTWHWAQGTDIRKPGTSIRKRQDFAGVLWYSFYERGGIIEDFLRHAVAYLRGVHHETLNTIKRPALAEEFLREIKRKPYLFILDGLERILVAYNRLDAAQMADDEADHPTDKIAQRDPCSCIRPEDDYFLRQLATPGPSKVLISTRLTPSILVNQARQPMPGVKRVPLAGLRPADAEVLLRSQGVRGDSAAIQAYLKTNCDCHPLVVGVLAGLINDYLRDRGNFDLWAEDAGLLGGARLSLGDLDLKQRKTHILKAAIEALAPTSKALLSTLSLVSQGVDVDTLQALSPHPKTSEASKLSHTVKDLERRGLLQYDANAKRFDLHPVVRGVTLGLLKGKEKDQYGRGVVDYFQSRPHNPYEKATTLADVEDGVQIVRTLIQMGRMQEAANAFRGDLANALGYNLEANDLVLSLLKAFFPESWVTLPAGIDDTSASYLANEAGLVLGDAGRPEEALAACTTSLRIALKDEDWSNIRVHLSNISNMLIRKNALALVVHCRHIALNLAWAAGNQEDLFRARLDSLNGLVKLGRFEQAKALWAELDPMGRVWSRSIYRPGDAERLYAQFLFEQGELNEGHLDHAERLARSAHNRLGIRELAAVRSEWRAERGEWTLAAESCTIAVSMAREVGQVDAWSETLLVLAHFHLGTLHDPKGEAERLETSGQYADRPLAELWLAIGDKAKAVKFAREAYTWAWADGEPYVRRYELNKAIELLKRLGEPPPTLPPYDPAKHPPFPWEADVLAAIERLKKKKAEKEAEQAAAEAKQAEEKRTKPGGGPNAP